MPFKKLTLPERQRRIDACSKSLLSCCVDRRLMSDSDELNYFNKNEELAVDIITMLDGIKLRIQNELKLNLQKYTDDFTPLNEVDESACERQSEDMAEDIATNTTPQSTKHEKKTKT